MHPRHPATAGRRHPAVSGGAAAPPWVRRFRAPRATLPRWARLRPERCAYASNATGVWQVHTWDRSVGRHRPATRSPIGVPHGVPTPGGERVLWFEDATGDEVGTWWAAPFSGGRGTPLLTALAPGWDTGLALGTRALVAGLARRDGFTVYRARLRSGAPAEPWLAAAEPLSVEALSPDDQLVCIAHADPGDSVHPRLRVWRVADGGPVAEAWDGPAATLAVVGWAPEPGDPRLCLTEERSGFTRPAIWRLDSDERE
ncbi:MAG TPA: S9 family peptidase, partial [Candidatus Dormibacteraeota bacterium]|nr:S9 family peptidase [Candidatus Dormibacteraeota bacterium]